MVELHLSGVRVRGQLYYDRWICFSNLTALSGQQNLLSVCLIPCSKAKAYSQPSTHLSLSLSPSLSLSLRTTNTPLLRKKYFWLEESEKVFVLSKINWYLCLQLSALSHFHRLPPLFLTYENPSRITVTYENNKWDIVVLLFTMYICPSKPLLPLEKYACHDSIAGKTTRTDAYSQRAKAVSSLSSDSDRNPQGTTRRASTHISSYFILGI